MATEEELAALCRALIDGRRGLAPLRREIQEGGDPLGEALASLRPAAVRRAAGAIYTPLPIVHSMMSWLAAHGRPVRIVDPGAGSGRFILAAGQAFPHASLVAVETDPLAVLTLRANLCCRGWMDRTHILVKDYRDIHLPASTGVTAFVGNPPYVRHHGITDNWKAWYAARFAQLGIKASALAGLHLHFFLQTRLLARNADLGAFVTSAEWLDVNYGSALRELFLTELGGVSLHVLRPTVEAFPGIATTAAVAGFRVGETARPVRVCSVDSLCSLNDSNQGVDVPRARLRATPRWSSIVQPPSCRSEGGMELGELFRVHRGQVTGANAVWIAGEHAKQLPDRVKLAAVTRARDLLEAGAYLYSADGLRRVIDLPTDLDELTREERTRIATFLRWARQQGADQGYIARHRKSWWSVGLKSPAPILCTYMARRPPQFTLNACHARHINIAHGLYPRATVPVCALAGLVAWLNENIRTGSGRTYSGGLTKFEPKEIERLRVPALEALSPAVPPIRV